MPRRPKPPSQTWRTFLQNHLAELVSVDFFVVPTATFRVLYVFVVLLHHRRQVVHFNVTDSPTAAWTAQQIVEAFPDDSAPRYLVRDRDGIYGDEFRRRTKGMRITEVLTAPRSPWQNPFAERVIGTIRRELLDHVIVLNEGHLRRRLRSYLRYYHGSRTHLSLDKDAPEPRTVELPEHGSMEFWPTTSAKPVPRRGKRPRDSKIPQLLWSPSVAPHFLQNHFVQAPRRQFFRPQRTFRVFHLCERKGSVVKGPPDVPVLFPVPFEALQQQGCCLPAKLWMLEAEITESAGRHHPHQRTWVLKCSLRHRIEDVAAFPPLAQDLNCQATQHVVFIVWVIESNSQVAADERCQALVACFPYDVQQRVGSSSVVPDSSALRTAFNSESERRPPCFTRARSSWKNLPLIASASDSCPVALAPQRPMPCSPSKTPASARSSAQFSGSGLLGHFGSDQSSFEDLPPPPKPLSNVDRRAELRI
jgi:hypothetical protein